MSDNSSLHRQISAIKQENDDLWAAMQRMQSALVKAQERIEFPGGQDIFTPQVLRDMKAARGVDLSEGRAKTFITHSFKNEDGEDIGLIFNQLGGEERRFGITDHDHEEVYEVIDH